MLSTPEKYKCEKFMKIYSKGIGKITLHYTSTFKRRREAVGNSGLPAPSLFLPNRRFRTPLFRLGGQRRYAPPSAVETVQRHKWEKQGQDVEVYCGVIQIVSIPTEYLQTRSFCHFSSQFCPEKFLPFPQGLQ